MKLSLAYVVSMIVIAWLLTLGVMVTQEYIEIPWLRRPSD